MSASVSVKNYSPSSADINAEMYYVTKDGAEKKLENAGSDPILLQPAKDGIIALTAYYVTKDTIPADTEKLVIKATVKTGDETNTYDVASLYCGITAPVAAPVDSDSTTNGAHDPSIVKFEGDDNYYVYSSHHLIFTSTDLINWKKYDFTNINAKDISPATYNFISSNYANTTMNGTYWAPDVIYKEGDEHPYWMYISVSCGLGGRNSVISLMKSNSPLFWADSSADIVDAGIVFATKENSNYKTNSIDANIYTDPYDGKQYFVWGSFWGGIQAAPLTSEGRVEGIDYTSDSTILSTCQKFGTSVFTQKNGVAGPEGAWMLNHGDHRYMFTSYGWLGSNYNTRLARAELSKSFATDMGTQLTDANGVVMGTEQSKGSTSKVTGYKLIGSYRLGDGSMSIEGTGSNYYVPRGANDAHVYYGPGHNSAINAGDESFYISHTRKDGVDIAATLQARKMLWTSDGWPVVSPVTYAGEKEQALPKDMLAGTYDLASVGRTKFAAGSSSIASSGSYINRNYDLPVLSSKVTLKKDGTMANGLGTWEFDGDHTLTLTFAKDGDTSVDEFYKSGDVMEMYALFGYDKDEREPVIALTGVDQNHVTQFAKKSLVNSFTVSDGAVETEPVVIEKSAGGNPILGFDASGNILYAGDPAAYVDGDTVYLYAGHDTASNESYVMPEWVCYSSKDMKEWKYEGVTMKATDISWRNDNNSAWASQVVKYGDKYYMYYCTWTKSDGGRQSIGVAVSDSPTGPFKDPLGAPLVKGSQTTPQSASHDDIDPTVWIETVDGVEHRYLCWGNTRLYVCELNEDMTSIKDIDGDGSISMGKDIIEQTVKGAPASYTEAPWLYRRQDESGNYYGPYYLFYAMGWREQMAYATTDDLLKGEWDYGGLLMPPSATANTNHPSVIDFKGHTYFIYHNGSLPHGSGFRRVVCVEEFSINEDGTIDPIQETSTSLTGTASIITQGSNYLRHEYFVNSGSDGAYPITASVGVDTNIMDIKDAYWEILPGKADKDNEYYVSIQSYNKPGLYLQANSDKTVVLTQDATADTDGSVKKKMTFKTVKGLDGKEGSVSFESVSESGYYLTNESGALTLKKGMDAAAASFMIGSAGSEEIPALLATVDKVWYESSKTVHFRLNNATIYGSVNAYVAEYDANGVLTGVANENNIKVTAASQFVDINYARKAENSTIKLYVWKDMTPIAPMTAVTETALPYTIPEGYTSYFPFDETLTDGIANGVGVVVPKNIDGTSTSSPSYDEGYKGRAVKFTGSNSYGVKLGNVVTKSDYTVSFRMKASAFTQFTSALFIDSGSKSNENWLSAPFGTQTGGGTMIWSNNSSNGHPSISSSATLTTDKWYMITLTAEGSKCTMYVDGVECASGSTVNTIGLGTNTYLGVNYWDTPFNGLIDELYIYDGTALTAEQVESLYFATQN